MRIYQASGKDFKKIVAFFKEQRAKGATCVLAFGKAQTVDKLKKFVASRQGFEMFVCEDDEGRIRVVAGRERRGKKWNPKEPEMAINGFEAVDYNDYKRNDFTHRIELWKWIGRDNIKRGFELSELSIPEKAVCLVQALFGDAVTVVRVRETEKGRFFRIRIDWYKASL